MVKHLFLIISIIILQSLSNTATADDTFTVNGNEYKITSSTTLAIMKMEVPQNGHVVIPSEITYNTRTMKVTQIGRYYSGFFNNPEKVVSLVIPASINLIDYDPYMYINKIMEKCINLKKVVFEDSETSLRVPYSYYTDEFLKSRTFFCNSPIEEAYVGRNLNCWYYKHVYGAKTGFSSFYKQEKLKKVIIGNKVNEIGLSLFEGCINLKEIDIPQNVKVIEEAAFEDCSKLERIILHESLKSIGNRAFCGTAISSINLPNTLEKFGESVMASCNSLVSITLPDKIKEIPDNAFGGCEKLSTIVIGSNVNKISRRAFQKTQLRKIYSKIMEPSKCAIELGNNPAFSSDIFANAILYVPKGTVELYRNASGWNRFFNIQEDNTTMIEGVENDSNLIKDDNIYNMNGIKTDSPNGVYIKGRKKYIKTK